MKVGFIGVGNIGKPMAEQLAKPPFELTVFDVSPAATEHFAGKAKIAPSPAELGRDVEQVGICVRHDADVTAVVAGPDGLLQTMRPDTIIAVHSTVRPATVKTLAETAKAKGIHLLDAGVSGGPMGAAGKKLVTMIGGEAAQVERLKTMVEAFSGTIIHAGGTGMGMALKLCNNLITYMQLQAAIEGVGLAIAGGLDEKLLREVISNNGNMTTAMGQYLEFCNTGPARMGQEAYMGFKDATAGLAEKDLDFALGFAKDVGIELKGTETIRQVIREGLEEPINMTQPEHSLLYIDGKFRAAKSGKTYPNIAPATGEVIGTAADASTDDMEDAIFAARRAFDASDWSTDRALRLKVLKQFRDGLHANRERIKALAVAEVGSPRGCLPGPQCDAPISFTDFVLETLENFAFERELPVANTMGVPSKRYVWKEAAGVVGAITPWNVPLQINLAKCFPALAAGCTVILKPAPETPWLATVLAEIADKTDMPPGVFNVVTSANPALVGEQLVSDPRVDMISFTGSTGVGKRIMAVASEQIKKVFLELGGKSAFIVLDDADFAKVVPTSAFFVLYHAGQGCASFTRLLVPRNRYEEAIGMLKTAFEAMPYTDPTSDHQIMGPLISARQRERVLDYIHIGKEEGARLVTGGGVPEGKAGFYVQPTVFADVNNKMRIAQEEIFGPVLVVIPYEDDEDAIHIANDSVFGLSGGVASASTERGLAVARRIRTGTFAVNGANYFAADTPFGGYKQSGIGREMGREGFEEYLETKSVAVPA